MSILEKINDGAEPLSENFKSALLTINAVGVSGMVPNPISTN